MCAVIINLHPTHRHQFSLVTKFTHPYKKMWMIVPSKAYQFTRIKPINPSTSTLFDLFAVDVINFDAKHREK